jgi:hypothetical protein
VVRGFIVHGGWVLGASSYRMNKKPTDIACFGHVLVMFGHLLVMFWSCLDH